MKLKSDKLYNRKQIEIDYDTSTQDKIYALMKKYGGCNNTFYGIDTDGSEYSVCIGSDFIDEVAIKDGVRIKDNLYYPGGFCANNLTENDYYGSSYHDSAEYSPNNPWDAPGMKVSDFI